MTTKIRSVVSIIGSSGTSPPVAKSVVAKRTSGGIVTIVTRPETAVSVTESATSARAKLA